MSEEPRIIVIDLNEIRYWGECCMCDQYRRLDHAVAYWCGPVHMEIGHEFIASDGSKQTVGGMPVCKPCHDQHYPEPPAAPSTSRAAYPHACIEDRRLRDLIDFALRPAAEPCLTSEEQLFQAARCSCRGSDDYCPCQNVPDDETRHTRAETAR